MNNDSKAPIARVILFQLGYVAAALSYNSVSFVLTRTGQVPLAPTALGQATLLFAIYGLFLLAGARSYDKIYRIGMAVFLVPIVTVGILPPLHQGFDPLFYHYQMTWVLAIAINIYGLMVTVAGVIKGSS